MLALYNCLCLRYTTETREGIQEREREAVETQYTTKNYTEAGTLLVSRAILLATVYREAVETQYTTKRREGIQVRDRFGRPLRATASLLSYAPNCQKNE